MSETRTAIEVTAEHLELQCEQLVASWIDWVKSRVQTATSRVLPERALRNHIPPILKSLAGYVRDPVEFTRQEIIGNLKLHGQIRRDQGYSLQEVLAEFEGLADLVTRSVLHALQRQNTDECNIGQGEAVARVATGLRSMSFIAMAMFSRADDDRRIAIDASLEEFARAVCHEIRNPLNAITLTVQAIQQGQADEKIISQLSVIKDAARHCDHLLDTVHVLALASAAKANDRMISLEQGLSRLIEELSEVSGAAGIEFRIDRPLPGVNIEAILLYVVLANTLGNSIKYSDPEKPERWVAISATLLEEEHDTGFCELKITDNGMGIPEEFLPRVFQKEFRAHPGHAHGTGMGLYLAQQAVVTRGGEISIDSTEDEGTEVTIRMRCLTDASGALTADQFRVEALLGEAVQNELHWPPDLPEPEDADES